MNTNLSPSNGPVKPAKSASPLDTLAQLGTSPENLQKRARAKYLSTGVSIKLAALDSPLKKKYWNSFHCCSKIEVDSSGAHSVYCKNRWCVICNRIRTAALIRRYLPVLEGWPDKHFVTLTIPNCPSGELESTIRSMQLTFKSIQEKFKRQAQRGTGHKIVGLRKLEVTYNPLKNNFHPHFHVVVENRVQGQKLIDDWLLRFPASNIRAQDLRPADDNAVLELFKYFTKIVSKSKTDKSRSLRPFALDIIFQAIQKKRIFQPFGFVCPGSDEEIPPDEVSDSAFSLSEKISYDWIQDVHDWISSDGDLLSGYEPRDGFVQLVGSEVSPECLSLGELHSEIQQRSTRQSFLSELSSENRKKFRSVILDIQADRSPSSKYGPVEKRWRLERGKGI